MLSIPSRLTALLLAVSTAAALPAASAETAPQAETPVITAECTSGHPGEPIQMTLRLQPNTGFRACGITVKLPDILTPETGEGQAAVFHPGAALTGADAYSYFDAASGKLSLTYASASDGLPEDEIGWFTLQIAESADAETAYPITVTANLLHMNSGETLKDLTAEQTFTPLAQTAYTLSETAVTIHDTTKPRKLFLTPEPDAGTCTWSSNRPDIAIVTESGAVYGIADGTAVITATCGSQTFACTVTVRLLPPLVINYPEYIAERKGEQFQLTVSGAEEGSTPVFTSSDPNVASVSASGEVMVTAIGETDILVTAGEQTAVCHVVYLPYLRGDADLNEKVDAMDAQTVLNEYLETTVLEQPPTFNKQQMLAGDTDLDGSITTQDAMLILQYFLNSLNGTQPDWNQAASEIGIMIQ